MSSGITSGPDPNCQHFGRRFVVQRLGLERRIYNYCPSCGSEWTERKIDVDLGDVVTSEEILEVHVLLGGDQTLEELIRQH